MKKSFFVLTSLASLMFFGTGCTSNNPLSVAPQTLTPPTFSTIATSTHPGWKLYKTNNEPKFQIEIPTEWKIGEYTSDASPNRPLYFAFDASEVLSQKDFQSLDQMAGQVQINSIEEIPRWHNPVMKKIGPKNIEAGYVKYVTNKNSPNPWWIEKTQEKYFLSKPNFDRPELIIDLTLYYPNAEAKNTTLQNTLKDIVESFQWQ